MRAFGSGPLRTFCWDIIYGAGYRDEPAGRVSKNRSEYSVTSLGVEVRRISSFLGSICPV